MLEYWFMFPIALAISTYAMTFGISGAAFFAPLFLLLGIPSAVARGSALFIEFFGMSSGLIGFMKKKLVCFTTSSKILKFTIPGAIIGALLVPKLSANMVSLGLGVLLLGLALLIILDLLDVSNKCPGTHHNKKIPETQFSSIQKTGFLLGGIFTGLTSIGAGESADAALAKRYSGGFAAGTAVFVIAGTAIVGFVTHAIALIPEFHEHASMIISLVLFAIPGVLTGAQIGSRLSPYISLKHREKILAGTFILLGIIAFL